jgi:hypothetical protein
MKKSQLLPNAADAGALERLFTYAKKTKINPRGLKLFVKDMTKKIKIVNK